MLKIIYSIIILIPIYIFFYAQELILSPTKKPLEPYHQMRLDTPQKYNMNISSYFTKKEYIPYLFVTLNNTQPLSKKATKLRQEINDINATINFSNNNSTILMLHGKNGRKEDLLPIAQRYVALGFDCILVDIPAHGDSRQKRLYYGTKDYEKKYVDSVLDDIVKYHKIDKNKLLLWGYSLGGVFAIESAYHSKYNFKGMVLVSTFDLLEGVLEDKSKLILGDFLGEKIYKLLDFSLDKFYDSDISMANSLTLAKDIKIPIFLAHGEKDQLISINRGKKLFNQFSSPYKQLSIDITATHQTIFITKKKFYAKSGLFLLNIIL